MKKLNATLLTGVMALALSGALSLPTSATTFVNGGVAAGTNATIGPKGDPGSVNDPQSLTAAATIGTGIGVGTGSTVSTNAGSVSTFANSRGIWNSADDGSFSIDWGWENNVGGIYSTAETNQVRANWFYTFVASGDGLFNISGSVLGMGNFLFGLQPIYFSGSGGGQIGGDVFDPNGSGSLSFALVNGQSYTINAFNNGNISGEYLQDAASATANFDWKITYNVSPVPLPAALPLLAAGLGALGVAARKRRKNTV